MKLLDVYKALLDYAGLSSTKEGCISIGTGEDATPFVIKGKRVVLPTKEQLKSPDFSERLVFHPLLENCIRDESLVTERYRTAINVRLNRVYGSIIEKLLILIASTADQRNLGPDQVGLFTKTQKHKIDGKTIERFQKIMEAIPAKELAKLFVHVFVKRGAELNNKKCARAGIISFPFYKELTEAETSGKIRGVSVPKKDIAAYKALMEYLTPNLEKEHFYDIGSDSKFAPTMESLLHASAQVASRLNDVLRLFSKTFGDDLDEFLFTDAWADAFDNIGALELEVKSVPMQAGGEGAIDGVQPALPASQQPAQPQFQQPAPPAPSPYPWNQPPMQQMNPYMVPQYQQPQMMPVMQPGMMPMNPYMMPQQAPAVPTTGKGIDFEALCRVNPALAAAANSGLPQGNVTGFGQRAGFNMGQVNQQPVGGGWNGRGSTF